MFCTAAQEVFNPLLQGAGPIAQDAILREMQGAIARFDTCTALQQPRKGLQHSMGLPNCRVYQTELSSNDCKITERLRGKFLSIKLQLRVSSAQQVAAIHTALGEHPWVIMNF